MKRTTTFFGIALALFAVAFLIDATAGCYDPKSPNLPTCPEDATWPDPCAARPADAGSDG